MLTITIDNDCPVKIVSIDTFDDDTKADIYAEYLSHLTLEQKRSILKPLNKGFKSLIRKKLEEKIYNIYKD
jgi:hypothetical protein